MQSDYSHQFKKSKIQTERSDYYYYFFFFLQMTSHNFCLLPVRSVFQVTGTSVMGTIFPKAWISSFYLCLIRSYIPLTSNARHTHTYTYVLHTQPLGLAPLAETDTVHFLHSTLCLLFKTLSRRAKVGMLSCLQLFLFLWAVWQGVFSRQNLSILLCSFEALGEKLRYRAGDSKMTENTLE